jgi:hypothetical protein
VKKERKEKIRWSLIAGFVLLVAAMAVQHAGQQLRQPTAAIDVEEMIDHITAENIYVDNYNLNQEFQRTVEFISQEDLITLKQENELYQRLPDKDLYKVDWSHAQKGRFMAMVDLETEEVIMFYRLSGVELS